VDPVFTMIVFVTAIGCATGLIHKFLEGRVEIEKARGTRGSDALAGEVQALREEVQQLREQNADLILSFDTALQRLGALPSASRSAAPAGPEPAVPQPPARAG
jgi:hypothetical protein